MLSYITYKFHCNFICSVRSKLIILRHVTSVQEPLKLTFFFKTNQSTIIVKYKNTIFSSGNPCTLFFNSILNMTNNKRIKLVGGKQRASHLAIADLGFRI